MRFCITDCEMWAKKGSNERRWSASDEAPEIIRITALNVNITADDVEILDEPFDAFVRPKMFPILSEYIKALTGITQKNVDTAKPLVSVIVEYSDYKSWHPMLAHGAEDTIFKTNFDLIGIDYKLSDWGCVNIRDWLYGPCGFDASQIVNGEPIVSGNLAQAHNAISYLPDQGSAHQGVYDVYSIYAALKKLIRDEGFDFIGWVGQHHSGL